MGSLLSTFFNFPQPCEKYAVLKCSPDEFRDVSPVEREKEHYESLRRSIEPIHSHLSSIIEYKSSSSLIRNAISNPSSDSEIPAWSALCPQIKILYTFFEYSRELGESLKKIIMILCKDDVSKNIEDMKATTKLLADILFFAYEFDELKVLRPSIQNDFAYYRRALPKMRESPNADQLYLIPDVSANKMSLFYSTSAPMTRSLIDSCVSLSKGSIEVRHSVTSLLSRISCICFNFVSSGPSVELTNYFLKVLVNSVILYDYVEPSGAFIRGSKMDVGALVKLIMEHGNTCTDGLLNFLRYTALNFNSDTTPKSIKVLLS